MTPTLQMVDVVSQYRKIKGEIDEAIHAVLDSGQYVLGKEVKEFEDAAAKYLDVVYAIGCASGTDALQVAMMAIGIKPGDEIITTPFTFVATTETIVLLGATPVYVDIDPATFNIDPTKIANAITSKTKAIIPVHLYGHPVDMDPVLEISRARGIPIIEDLAQAMGAEYRSKKVGGLGLVGCVSFFPSKNLGAFGDAGMVVTNDRDLAERMRMIIVHGSRIRYRHEILGVNSRLDTLQAAVLKVKLRYLDSWHDARRLAAMRYTSLLEGSGVDAPSEKGYAKHIYHQYTLRAPNRDELSKELTRQGIPHAIYYPIPLHEQEAFARAGRVHGDLTHTEQAAREVLSLPMHTELSEEQQVSVASAVRLAMKQSATAMRDK